MHHAQAERAERQVCADAAAAGLGGQWARQGPAVATPAPAQKVVKHPQAGAFTGQRHLGHRRVCRIRRTRSMDGRGQFTRIGPCPRRKGERRRPDRRVHALCPAPCPTASALQTSHHAVLGPFAPADAALPTPSRYRQVARVGPPGAGFLVAEQLVKTMGGMQFLQHLNRRPHPHQQRQATRGQRSAQLGHAGLREGELSRMKLGAFQPLRLQDPQGRAGPQEGSGLQGCVVHQAQIALEPHQAAAHTTPAKACATRSTLACVSPATHIRPERMRYTACSSRNRSTWAALRPV